ncbi:MAG: hypothetical protein EON91_10115 [Brevundimonas sp.]|uniref:hypothetical protein n=1 Tax=Brevundimonas sp. TaxID=1871086 RepID=UPI0011FEFB4B|nr:hypothetical protein [Brevundimonas sp.]RZJ17229.1 MAG: hypothetical protein EON91_10115 [Brevundimonas sp.]
MSPETFAAIVADAALSPNVHNIQPTGWRRIDDATVAAIQAPGRTLPVGDPTGRDVAASHGAAVEGFVLAASLRGLGMTLGAAADGEVARLTVTGEAAADPLALFLTRRRTYRGAFTADSAPAALDALSKTAPDLTVLRDRADIDHVARLNDRASLGGFRHAGFRAELLAWMRLSPRDPRWAVDGLNARAMQMSGLEAAAAGVVLRPGVFKVLDRLGLAGALTGEAAVVRSSAAVALFHRPADEAPFETGRRWHRVWLEMTRQGLSAAPMTVLADDETAAQALADRFGRPAGARVVTVFRIGVAPDGALPPPARRAVADLIV